ncbi:BnaC02g48490D [Brassica napus]|uniref:(rape) hypothetical protein n=1 Tax=Brassica napus TaxID=3708 RepID=A0A078JSI4_BRANA|nr:unnamed protein product [Brassica napus]CDY68606.1 BnaC02g48490D [Brassica napus]
MTAAPPPNCGFWNFGRQKCDKSSVPTIHFTNPPFSFRSHKKKFLERDRARAITTPSDLTVLGRSSENLTVSAILDWFNNGGSEDGGINKCVIERFDKEAAEMYKRSFKYVWVLAEVDWRQKREFLLEKRVKGVDVKEALRLQKENNFLILDVRPEAKYKDAEGSSSGSYQCGDVQTDTGMDAMGHSSPSWICFLPYLLWH